MRNRIGWDAMLRRWGLIFSYAAVSPCLGGCSGNVEKADEVGSGDLPDAGSLDAVESGDAREAGSVGPDAPVEASGCTHTPGNFGQFLITLSPSPFRDRPNLLSARIEIVENDSMVLTAQFFDYERAHLVGNPIATAPIPLRADGFFRTEPLRLDIPGEAHCALPDTPVMLDVTLVGGPVCDDTIFACGEMNGSIVGLGVDLNGSTFTVQRIENDVIPPPVLDCDRSGDATACK